ncbi:hypothetical protein BMS3Bbin02_00032 [bacterium BMS3Bbin02]|nr:hypothetical protein BMS3Bbin02_00032 [bacterium BMS3Bbin02]
MISSPRAIGRETVSILIPSRMSLRPVKVRPNNRPIPIAAAIQTGRNRSRVDSRAATFASGGVDVVVMMCPGMIVGLSGCGVGSRGAPLAVTIRVGYVNNFEHRGGCLHQTLRLGVNRVVDPPPSPLPDYQAGFT